MKTLAEKLEDLVERSEQKAVEMEEEGEGGTAAGLAARLHWMNGYAHAIQDVRALLDALFPVVLTLNEEEEVEIAEFCWFCSTADGHEPWCVEVTK